MNDLEYLINLYLDGLASRAEVLRLNELLRSDANARRVFTEHLNLDSALAEIAAGMPGKRAALEDIVVLNRQAILSNAFAYGVLAVAATLFISVGLWWWQFADPQTNQYARQLAGADRALSGNQQNQSESGMLSSEHGSPAMLIDEAAPLFSFERGPDGKLFEPGIYELISGVAHLRFASGAEMILNGPAQLEIIDSMHARMEYGKVRVIAPPSAKGFTVSTPSAEYIDIGTEFGLDVDRDDGASNLFVFDGQVNVARSDSKEVVKEVIEGDSSRYFKGVIAGPSPDFVSAEFPTPNEIGFVRWQDHVQDLLEDESLIGFYPFRQSSDSSLLVNQASKQESTDSLLDGKIVGARWVSGRWPGKDSLLFDGDREYVQLDIPGNYSELTIAAWLKIDRLDYEMNAIINSDRAEKGDVHFQITRQAIAKGAVQGWDTTDTFIGPPLKLGQWVHVVMVISVTDKYRKVFANGQLVRDAVMKGDSTISPGSCRLGNWLPAIGHHEKRVRAFRGKIDELAIWKRSLNESEIRALVESGRPSLHWQE
jgi:ferric-dicitrate binding protein FerR (iron transport regulator)